MSLSDRLVTDGLSLAQPAIVMKTAAADKKILFAFILLIIQVKLEKRLVILIILHYSYKFLDKLFMYTNK